MATLRDLKGRIGSVKSSEKITGAMKMISSAKMTMAVRDIKRLLPFRTQLEAIIGNLLGADAEFSSPLTQQRELSHATMVVTGSDDGLCGAYNLNIFKQLLERVNALRAQQPGMEITVVPVGAKIAKACAKLAGPGVKVEVPEGVNSKSDADTVKAFTRSLQQKFLAGLTDLVEVVYMQFISPSRQRLKVQQLLPVSANEITGEAAKADGKLYIFEPDAPTIFATALPLMLLSTVQEVFCENRASEQAARVMAMQSANDNATKLLDQLQLEYNKLRQQSITAELLDIIGGQVR